MLPESDYSSSMNLAKFQDTKYIHRTLLDSYTLTMKEQRKKSRKQSHLSSFILFDLRGNASSFSPFRIILLLFSDSVVSDTLQPHGLQHSRLPCPSLSSWGLLKFMSTESVMLKAWKHLLNE